MQFDHAFVSFSADRLMQLASCAESCLDTLSQEQLWARHADHENAVGNLVLHLCGNLREFIMVGIAGEANTRQRDMEFSQRGGMTNQELQGRLRATVIEAAGIIRAVDGRRLLERVVVKGNDIPVLIAIYHAVEHFAMHTGQIIFVTKRLAGQSLLLSTDLQAMYKHFPPLS